MQTTAFFDAIVIGSGPGGASTARDLVRQGWRVLILEQGDASALTGTLSHMARIAAVPGKGAFIHRDGSVLVQGVTTGGSSAINFATAADPPAALFASHGIDLQAEVAALRDELPIGPLPDELIGPMALRILDGARSLGLQWNKLDKMIRPQLCRSGCWRCLYGCPFGAKWTARDFVVEAVKNGAVLLDRACARRLLIRNDTVQGVEYVRGGDLHRAVAPVVVLAGGGVGSPRLLHEAGLAPRNSEFFSDPVVAVIGSIDANDGGAEVPMAAGMRLDDEGISLADMALPRAMYQAFSLQAGRFDRLFAHRQSLSIMVKIRDEIGGSIGPRWVDKRLQDSDRRKLARGIEMARDILGACGARNQFETHHFAAHPGGSIRIGAGVDHNLQTKTHGLFVCDASVLPSAWGLPPTLTLLALGKRLSAHLGADQVARAIQKATVGGVVTASSGAAAGQ